MTEETDVAGESTTNAYDTLIAALSAVVAIGVVWIAARDIAGGSIDTWSDPRSPAFFPFVLGIVLFIVAGAIALWPRPAQPATARKPELAATAAIVAGAVLLAGYVYGFFALGFVTASALAIIGLALLAGERRWPILLPLAIVFPLVLKIVAERALAILLPKGLFW